ncbi:Por secretion system C-terminal sorting domain-containing protein [Chitinophaga sp. YR573]|uniref:T9SS type A sorting domain-containing protein n=1 Tax=Chitinophaga sp. YR573 TaxID=1881040 RepID=UPI0008C76ECA|nr:T9SS type A sorting domain-containing protein [Chitinophaga sp. YR573]SEV95671.1 Por secretion system C-terminal sorting domain-containing protein [Chitinophaga sp. YR573]
MKKIFTFLLCLCAYMIPTTYAQVTSTISYTSAPLNPGSCNVFNTATPATIGGFVHYPVSGGVGYDGSGGILLSTLWSSSTSNQLGTAFAIAYPFKKGHTYTVTVTASSNALAGSSSQPMYASFYAALPDANQTNPTPCGGVAYANYSIVQSANAFNVPSGGSAGAYSFTAYTPTADMNIVTILAGPSVGSTVINKVKITKISITDNVVLNMVSTALVTKVCGTALSQNVGVSIPVVDGITAYHFNVGANSGWLYNGSPAPATITTPSSAITLTADACGGAAITNVSASVDVAGHNYAAGGVVPVANVNPTPSISGGVSTICTSSTFTVNAPCSSTVTWSASSGIATLTPSGASVLVTRVTNGSLTLTATLSGGCFSTPVAAVKTLNIGVGPYPTLTNISLVPYPYYGISAYANSTTPGPYYWYVDGVLKKTTATGSSDAIAVGNCGTQHRLQVKVINDCGEAWSDPYYWTNTCTMRIADPSLTATPDSILRSQPEPESDKTIDVTLAPNPSSNNVIVSINPGKTSSTLSFIKAIRILDISGKTQKTFSYPNSSQSKVTIDVSEFKSGIYLINVFDGHNNYIKKLVIQ